MPDFAETYKWAFVTCKWPQHFEAQADNDAILPGGILSQGDVPSSGIHRGSLREHAWPYSLRSLIPGSRSIASVARGKTLRTIVAKEAAVAASCHFAKIIDELQALRLISIILKTCVGLGLQVHEGDATINISLFSRSNRKAWRNDNYTRGSSCDSLLLLGSQPRLPRFAYATVSGH
ncbi:hypothetical protein IF2G_09685 [Cordyceps javanica]|nr:hypothetical protein IF2G_09685 [Cordyceps javanica]